MKLRALASLFGLVILGQTATGCSSGSSGKDACAAPVTCNESCVIGSSNVTTVVDGCTVTECCVPVASDGGGADASDGGSADAGLFACGSSLQCDGRTQYCSAVSPPHSTTNYACDAIPAACASDVTCACFATQGSGTGCTESNGDVTVTLLEP